MAGGAGTDSVSRMKDASPHLKATRLKARLAGLLFLIVMAAGIFAEYGVIGAVVVSGDAAATAHNILDHETLYRLGFAANLIDYTVYLAVTVILYDLLKPAGRSLAVAAAAFSVAGTAIVASVASCTYAPLILLHMPGDWQAAALLSLRLRTAGYDVSLVFFGIHFLLLGVLILRSGLLPRVLGALQVLCGACYLVNSFASVLALALPPYVLMPCIVAELALASWLLVVGVRRA
jgi:Domain of unknown function (DUF4386)